MIHIKNINLYMQPASNLGHEPDYLNQILSQAHKETSSASHSTPIPPPGYDWIPSFQYEGLKQRSDAWDAVCELITELDPNWHSGPGTGRVKALKAIRKLAAPTKAKHI